MINSARKPSNITSFVGMIENKQMTGFNTSQIIDAISSFLFAVVLTTPIILMLTYDINSI